MTVTIEVSFGELADKISILEIKAARISDHVKLANVSRELASLRAAWNAARLPVSDPVLQEACAALRATNERLWDIEDEIRAKERSREFDEAFIDLARRVYITNDQRADIKRRIDLLLGSRFTEEKSYQPY
jgi:hypothetical protein